MNVNTVVTLDSMVSTKMSLTLKSVYKSGISTPFYLVGYIAFLAPAESNIIKQEVTPLSR